MASDDLVDDRAEEEAEEAEEGEEEGSPPPSPEGEGDDLLEDSSEEEGEDEDGYDLTDKFLAGDEDEEEGGPGDEAGGSAKKRRKKRRRENPLVLEEDDYDLLEENQVTGIRRPRVAERKRIRKETDEAPAQDDRTAAERVREQLGFRDEAEGLEDVLEDEVAAAPAPRREEEPMFDEDDEDDEFRDFIVDDEPGAGGGQAAPRRAIRRANLPAGVSTAALREAQEIFGDVSSLLDLYQSRRRGAGDDDDEDADPLEDEEFDDEEAAAQYREEREQRARERTDRRTRAQVEPALMEAAHMLPQDEALRVTDKPERLQLARGRDPEHFDPAAAAEWIYRAVFDADAPRGDAQHWVTRGILEVDGPPPDGRQAWRRGELVGDIELLSGHRGLTVERREGSERRAWRRDEHAQKRLRDSIAEVVRLLWEESKELPLIAGYHKEAAGELLAMRREDRPETTSRSEAQQRADYSRPDCPEGVVQAKQRRVRRWDALWAVYAASLKWRALQRRLETREAVFRDALSRAPVPEAGPLQEALDSLLAADSFEAVADADAKFRLASAAADAAAGLADLSLSQDGGGQRRRVGGSAGAFLAGKRAGLDGVVAAFGLTPAQLAENLEGDYKKHEAEDLRVPPVELAESHTSEAPGLGEPDAVMARARSMAARQLAVEPGVRAWVRRRLHAEATLSTELTTAGEGVVDAFHAYGRVARLRGKPVRLLEETDHFLRAVLAEREGLLTVKLEMPAEALEQRVLKPLADMYTSDSVSAVSQGWNEQRRAALAEAVQRGLLPGLLAELRGKLASEARERVAAAAADTLWGLASAAPLKVMSTAADDEEVTERRVMAVVWGPGADRSAPNAPATTLVMLDAQGNLVDLLACSQLSGHIPRPPKGPAVEAGGEGFYSIFSDPRKGKDAERIRAFLKEHTPHVVAVGAAGLEARQLKADLDTVRDAILEHDARVMAEQETGNIDVQFVEENVAAVWADCAAAREELGDQPVMVRRAVALGRCLLEPLPVLASLCGSSREVKALQLHPLQAALPQEDLLRIAETTMVTVVNQVGVDVNAAASQPWMAAPLQFAAGLGPRKARALLQAVKRAAGAESRHALLQELGVLGRTVFVNAAPFLRVRRTGVDVNNAQLHALDNTRVHPQHYKFAMSMAASAMGEADAADEDTAGQVEAALANPDGVEALDLQQYGDHIRANGSTPAEQSLGQSILNDIRMELLAPYGEVRPEREPMREEEVFWLLMASEKEALKIGRLVEARVRNVVPAAAFCTLPDLGGMEAMVDAASLSSTGAVDCTKRVRPGDVIKGRIVAVDPVRFIVELNTSSEVLNDADSRWEKQYCATDEEGQTDEYYTVPDKQALAQKAAQEAKARSKRAFIPRPIRHPLYKNLAVADAISHLSENCEDGDCLFRPSPKGTHALHLTLRLRDDGVHRLYTNTDIQEGSKEDAHRGMGQHLKLGKPLKITVHGSPDPIKFEDLDEVVATYVEPYLSRFRSLLDHAKFREGDWLSSPDNNSSIQDELRRMKAQSGGRAVYLLGLRYDLPGVYYIGHILNNTPHRELFSITPKGYYFRSKVVRSLDALINEFKRKPVPDSRAAEIGGADAQELGYQAPSQAALPAAPSAYGGANGYAAPAAAASTPWEQLQQQQAPPPPPLWAAGGDYSSQGVPLPGPPPGPPAAAPSYGQPYALAAPAYQQPYGDLYQQPPQQQRAAPAPPAQDPAAMQAAAQRLAAQFQQQQQASQQGVPPPPPPPPQYTQYAGR